MLDSHVFEFGVNVKDLSVTSYHTYKYLGLAYNQA